MTSQRQALKHIAAAGAALSPRAREVLAQMHFEKEELVYERGTGYVGLSSVSARTVRAILRAAAVSLEQYSTVGKFERYRINETGRALIGVGRK